MFEFLFIQQSVSLPSSRFCTCNERRQRGLRPQYLEPQAQFRTGPFGGLLASASAVSCVCESGRFGLTAATGTTAAPYYISHRSSSGCQCGWAWRIGGSVMDTPDLPAIRALRPAWNKRLIGGQKRPLKPKHVWAIRVRLELAANHRDLVPLNMASDSALLDCDLVRIQVVDLMPPGQIEERASVLRSKTQKPVRFKISEGTRALVAKWMEDPMIVGSKYLWPCRLHKRLQNSTRQYVRIVRDWVTSIGVEAIEIQPYGPFARTTHCCRWPMLYDSALQSCPWCKSQILRNVT